MEKYTTGGKPTEYRSGITIALLLACTQ